MNWNWTESGNKDFNCGSIGDIWVSVIDETLSLIFLYILDR
jgi:hypothetical protein